MKSKAIQYIRLAVQIVFVVGLATSLIGGFMTIWPAVLIGSFLLAILAGNFYCGWICPFGSLQEWLGKIGSLFMKKKLRMPRRAQKVLQFSKYIVYTFIAVNGVLGIAGGLAQNGAFNSNYYFLSLVSSGSLERIGQIASIPVLVFLATYLITALLFDRPFCNYLCPDGVKYSLLSFMRVFTIRRNACQCVNCKKCSHVCPMQIDVANANNLRNANCINCMQCVAACPVKNTLSYGPCLGRTPVGTPNKKEPVVGPCSQIPSH